MIDQNDLDYYLSVFRDTAMGKRELEHHLHDVGLSRQMAKIIASKCGRKMNAKPEPMTKTSKGDLWNSFVRLAKHAINVKTPANPLM